MASRKLTDYERKRLENIKRNDEMLAAFKIQAKASELSAASKRRKVETKSYKVSPQKNLKTQTPVVIRRSLRARGMPPDSKGLTDDFFDSKNRTPKSKSPEESSLPDMSSENRTPKSPSPEESSLPDMSGPLSFKDAYARSEYDSNRPFIDAILRVTKGPHFGLVEEKFDSVLNVKLKPEVDLPSEEECIESLGETCDLGCAVKEESDGSKVCENEDSSGKHKVVSFDFIKGVIKTEKSEPRSSVDLGSLTLKEENIARVMKNRIMMVKFFPCTDIRMVVAGGKSGEVAFWNMDSEQEEDGIYLYHTHTGPISGIITQESCLSKIFTSCYDGFIRLMDVETEVFDLVHSSEYAIYSLSQQANNVNNLCFSEGQGILNSWDVRTGKFSSEWLLHEARINTIDFNSQNPNIMATSSSDGTACLWDLRSMDTDKPKPLKIASHGKAVHSAYFSPSGSCLATASFDDTVGIWSGAKFEKTSMIDHNNQTGRWISSFRAIWGWDDSYIFIGNMKRGVDVISPVQRRIIMTLQSPHITAIPCRFHAHPYEVGMLAGATSGGQVYVWTSS